MKKLDNNYPRHGLRLDQGSELQPFEYARTAAERILRHFTTFGAIDGLTVYEIVPKYFAASTDECTVSQIHLHLDHSGTVTIGTRREQEILVRGTGNPYDRAWIRMMLGKDSS